VLERAGADIIDAACKDAPAPRESIGDDGLIADPTIRAAIDAAMRGLVEAAIARRCETRS
jgi:hypothetical protein